MAYSYNISDLLQQAFGLTGSIVPLSGQQYLGYASQKIDPYNKIPTIEVSEQTATSYLGTPIIQSISFDLNDVSWFEMIEVEKKRRTFYGSEQYFTLPSATMVDFSQDKIIEKTRIAGRKGTVKEYIGMDDWSIRIRGIAINEEKDEAPSEVITLLKQLKDVPVSIPIVNDMCRWLDIRSVTVESIEFPSLEGYPGVQPFVIQLCSDEVFELKYKEGL